VNALPCTTAMQGCPTERRSAPLLAGAQLVHKAMTRADERSADMASVALLNRGEPNEQAVTRLNAPFYDN
jgi:hypothetical protein